jgi:hypothetical protein
VIRLRLRLRCGWPSLSLCAEIQNPSGLQQTLIGLNITAIAAIAGVALSKHRLSAILLVLPLVCLTLGFLWSIMTVSYMTLPGMFGLRFGRGSRAGNRNTVGVIAPMVLDAGCARVVCAERGRANRRARCRSIFKHCGGSGDRTRFSSGYF